MQIVDISNLEKGDQILWISQTQPDRPQPQFRKVKKVAWDAPRKRRYVLVEGDNFMSWFDKDSKVLAITEGF